MAKSLSITELRSVTGLNKKDFAEYYHIPYTTFLNWERYERGDEKGGRKPSETVLFLLNELVMGALKEEAPKPRKSYVTELLLNVSNEDTLIAPHPLYRVLRFEKMSEQDGGFEALVTVEHWCPIGKVMPKTMEDLESLLFENTEDPYMQRFYASYKEIFSSIGQRSTAYIWALKRAYEGKGS